MQERHVDFIVSIKPIQERITAHICRTIESDWLDRHAFTCAQEPLGTLSQSHSAYWNTTKGTVRALEVVLEIKQVQSLHQILPRYVILSSSHLSGITRLLTPVNKRVYLAPYVHHTAMPNSCVPSCSLIRLLRKFSQPHSGYENKSRYSAT